MHADQNKTAFSLVELSIVLVILGLLTGGILAGQSLIHAAELRGVSTDYAKYTTAVNAFRDKYFAVPGDMANATKVWGVSAASSDFSGNDRDCKIGAIPDKKTCNGSGDGKLWSDLWDADPFSPDSVRLNENYFFWHHLANAGLVEGSYTHAALPIPDGSMTGLLAPLRYPKATYWNPHTYLPGEIVADTTTFAVQGNVFETMGQNNPPFTPEDAWNIDTKMDDGKPNQGAVLATKGDSSLPCTNVANTAGETNAAYNLSAKGQYCSLYFTKSF